MLFAGIDLLDERNGSRMTFPIITNLRITSLVLPLLLVLGSGRPARDKPALPVTIVVRAEHQSYPETPVNVELPHVTRGASRNHRSPDSVDGAMCWVLRPEGAGKDIPCQLDHDAAHDKVDFIMPRMRKGETRSFHLVAAHKANGQNTGVRTTRRGDDIEVTVDGRLFTRYTTHLGPNKPFFYPVLTAEGDNLTRRYPMVTGTGDSMDHPHHRGLWFTHGSVNGIDFWGEQGVVGKTINTGFDALQSGPVLGAFQASTDWRGPTGKLVATDTRRIRVWRLNSEDRILDFEITLAPAEEPLVFGDTKEGTFGLRAPDEFAPALHRSGHILSSTGKEDGAVWSTNAEWVDYHGVLGGKPYGIALFDHPANLRHPETWHARDYGLFAVNPFGLHDFGKGPKGIGCSVAHTGS